MDEIKQKGILLSYLLRHDKAAFKNGNIDIVDRHGNQKWRDKSWAIEVAKQYCECGGDWSKEQE